MPTSRRGLAPKDQPGTHTCPAPGCGRQVAAKWFACPADWRLVPRGLQARIYAHYEPGQDWVSATPAYREAALAAVAAIGAAKGGEVPGGR